MFQENYHDYGTQHSEVREPDEPFSGPTPQALREQLVSNIWADQLFRSTGLTTAQGKAVRIHSPGWINNAAGPDFRRAEVEIDGDRRRGDIKIHTYAAYWVQHKHDTDPEYDNVILHVVMWNNRPSQTVRTYSGGEVPILVLSDYLIRPLEELEKEIGEKNVSDATQAKAVLTHERLRQITGPQLPAFLDAAGDWRMVTKCRRLLVALKYNPPEEVFYRALLEAFGYLQNRSPFSRLALAVPLSDAMACMSRAEDKDRRERLFARLVTGAGLLPEPPGDGDNETERFVRNLLQLAEQEPVSGRLSRADWTLRGVRPAAHPLRRIAAGANLLANCGEAGPLEFFTEAIRLLGQTGTDKKRTRSLRQAMTDQIAAGPDHYLHYHYTLGSKTLPSRRELIGKQLAGIIVVNVVVPMLLALCKKNGDAATEMALHQFYNDFPKLDDDKITKFVKSRILESPTQTKLITTARRQQALYQIYNDLIIGK